MNPPNEQNPRQRFQQKEKLETGLQARTQAKMEFGSVEEMLRHDALHTPSRDGPCGHGQQETDGTGLRAEISVGDVHAGLPGRGIAVES